MCLIKKHINLKRIGQTKVLLRLLFFILFSLWVIYPTKAAPRYKIAIIHSYEKNYHDAKRYRSLLEKELTAQGLKFEIKEFFLNCDELRYDAEMARSSFFIDEITKWGGDAIAIFNNQATFSLLKCNNPKLRDIPVVFSGVYHPDVDLIRSYPNVTGYVDIPDYAATVRMIERIMSKSRIIVMSGTGMIDNQMWLNLEQQCRKEGIKTFEGDVFKDILSHRIIKNPYEEGKTETINEKIDTTVVMRLLSEEMPLRTIQQTARGSETYLMLTSRTYNSMDAQEFFINPSFATINEGFGANDKMLGGYFTPLETQLKEMAEGIALRLRKEMPKQQITPSSKQYVLNWKVLQANNISTKDLPEEYQIMYIPFSVSHRYYLLAGYISGGVLLFTIFALLIYKVIDERKRKLEALRNLLYEHETLKLAIEGGTTYAWRQTEDKLSFDSHFYKLIAHTGPFITLEQILPFIYPDDQEPFSVNFLQNSPTKRYKGEYRCKFNGKYQWWEFRYNVICHDEKLPVVTGLLQNIQEFKDREEELIQAREIAEKAELKQSFLNNMSHEIRTPLNAIAGFANLLTNTPELEEEDKQNYVDIINTNTELLLRLINDILELSRLDSGSANFNLRREDVRTLLSSYYQTFGVQVKPDLKFLQDFPNEDCTVYVDASRLQQVITNFLTNANKFTQTGYIKLGYRYSAGEHAVGIFVEDTGKGIPHNELKIIFSRFYKHYEFAQGTGLGLAICNSIAEQLQGYIEVESEEGKGSRFTIVLPVA